MSQYNYGSIKISKSSISIGDEVTISYSGYLAANGAESVYAHLGYNENWDDLAQIQMKKGKDGIFSTKIKVKNQGILNLCFKDSYENWDNNQSNNYSFPIIANTVDSELKSATDSNKATTVAKEATVEKMIKDKETEKIETTETAKAKPKKSETAKKATTKSKQAEATETEAIETTETAKAKPKKSETAKKATSKSKQAETTESAQAKPKKSETEKAAKATSTKKAGVDSQENSSSV